MSNTQRKSGFLGNRAAMREAADSECAEWRRAVSVWSDAFGNRPIKTSELLGVLRESGVLLNVWGGRGALGAAQRLGRELSLRRGRIFGNLKIMRAGKNHASRFLYRLGPVKEGENKPPQPPQSLFFTLKDGNGSNCETAANDDVTAAEQDHTAAESEFRQAQTLLAECEAAGLKLERMGHHIVLGATRTDAVLTDEFIERVNRHAAALLSILPEAPSEPIPAELLEALLSRVVEIGDAPGFPAPTLPNAPSWYIDFKKAGGKWEELGKYWRFELLKGAVIDNDAMAVGRTVYAFGGALWLTGEHPGKLVLGWPKMWSEAEKSIVREALNRVADTVSYQWWRVHVERIPLKKLVMTTFNGTEVIKEESDNRS